MDGLTGKIKFDQRGQRTDFELDIIELKRDGLTKVGKKYLSVLFMVLEKMVPLLMAWDNSLARKPNIL